MIDRAEYVQMLKDGGKDMLKLYENGELVAKIYVEHSEHALAIRSRKIFKGWQEKWDWVEPPYEFGTRYQYEAQWPLTMGISIIRYQCIEIFGFDPGPVPD